MGTRLTPSDSLPPRSDVQQRDERRHPGDDQRRLDQTQPSPVPLEHQPRLAPVLIRATPVLEHLANVRLLTQVHRRRGAGVAAGGERRLSTHRAESIVQSRSRIRTFE